MILPTIGPFQGCVPPWRIIIGLLGCLSGGILMLICGRRWFVVGFCALVVGSFIWLTGHHDCGDAGTKQQNSHRDVRYIESAFVANPAKGVKAQSPGGYKPKIASRGSAGHLIGGGLVFVFGFIVGSALMKLSFYLADAPYGTHTWRSRSLYLCCGLISVIYLFFSVRAFRNMFQVRCHAENCTFVVGRKDAR